MFFNGEPVELVYQPAATTDGDSLVVFRRSDVIVTGDIFLTTTYPFIDLDQGGEHSRRDRRAEQYPRYGGGRSPGRRRHLHHSGTWPRVLISSELLEFRDMDYHHSRPRPGVD